MARWELQLTLDEQHATPRFLQLARAVEADIRRGRLSPGDVLPGSRRLASSLGVHRNTVIAGYNELLAKGWVVTRPGGGTFVAPELPQVRRRPVAVSPAHSVLEVRPSSSFSPWREAIHPRGTLVLTRGFADVRLFPTKLLARAYRHVLARHGNRLLGYGDPRGEPRLRKALAQMVSSTRGLAVGEGGLMVTRGSQMGLYLAARALLEPGDAVAVEALGNKGSWAALQMAGANLVPIALDEGGMQVESLERVLAKQRLRAVYVTPHHQFPTTVDMHAARRLRLLALARRHRFAILEDDYDYEFHYDGPPVAPLLSADEAGVVVYLGSLSKVLAPSLRVGFAIAPPEVLTRMALLREHVDVAGDRAVESAVAALIEDGELPRHIRRMRRVYGARRDALASALQRQLPAVLSFQVPTGGMALWAEVAPDIALPAWSARGAAAGVAFTDAAPFRLDGKPGHHTRLGFTLHSERELEEAARRMASSLGR